MTFPDATLSAARKPRSSHSARAAGSHTPRPILSSVHLLVTSLLALLLFLPATPSGASPVASAPALLPTITGGSGNVTVAASGNETSQYEPPYQECSPPSPGVVAYTVWSLHAHAWGGRAPYNFTWRYPDSSTPGYGANVSPRITTGGSVRVNVTDSLGRVNFSFVNVNGPVVPMFDPVVPWWVGSSCFGTTPVPNVLLISLTIFAVILLGVFLVRVSRGRREREPPDVPGRAPVAPPHRPSPPPR